MLYFQALDSRDEYVGSIKNVEKSEKNWPNYLLGAFSELSKDGYRTSGADVAFGGDIPAGKGLSSSAAVESGMLFVLNELFEFKLTRLDLARLAQRAENQFVGMNCGIMDMFASLMGKRHHALKLDCRSLEVEYLPMNLPEHIFVLCDSGVKHQLVESEYNTRRRECEAGMAILKHNFPEVKKLRDVDLNMIFLEKKRLDEAVFKRCRFVVEENARVNSACNALKSNDLTTFGKFLCQSHEGLRDLYEVTCPETDFLVETALRHSAVSGARQMGGGFGGCTLNLIRRDAVGDFQEKMKVVFWEKWRRALEFYPVEIADGVEKMDFYANKHDSFS